ncbi:MAG: homoserine dehydrogenase [Bryobacteraceae bacterium]|jgi:homoserine dehydrogenase
MDLALIGFGNVGRAFARLIEWKRASFPFRITGIHTARHGTAIDPKGLAAEPLFGPPAVSVDEFLERAAAEAVIEITPLNPASGEPALSHIRAAFRRGMHVVTANKGPVAYAYAALREQARASGVQFRFESTVLDGAPVFNMVRNNLPGVAVLGFTGVLNSTTKIIVEAMAEGRPMEEGIELARRMGIAEADPSYDIDGWDSAVKAAALANVLMDARLTPRSIEPRGIGGLTPARVRELAQRGETVRIVSRGERTASGVRIRVLAEEMPQTDLLACVPGTSNLLLLETDLMGTVGTVSINPGVDQTAYGLFGDLVDIAREM